MECINNAGYLKINGFPLNSDYGLLRPIKVYEYEMFMKYVNFLKKTSKNIKALFLNEMMKTNDNKDEINDKYSKKQSVVKESLAKQLSELNQTQNEISKKVSQEDDRFESEKKRVIKESDQRLKEELQEISKKLQSDISNV